jgi:hypothetical protein
VVFATVLLSKNELLIAATMVMPAAALPPTVTRPEIDADESFAGVCARQNTEHKESAARIENRDLVFVMLIILLMAKRGAISWRQNERHYD